MKIFFDLDHTLFSTRRFYRFFEGYFVKMGIPWPLFRSTFEASRDEKGNYRASRHFRFIAQRCPQIARAKLEKKFRQILNQINQFLYPDVESVLKRLEKKNKLVLITFGDSRFQREKLKGLKIKKYFRKIFITQDVGKIQPLRRFLKNHEETVFVDDNPEALSKIKKNFPEVVTVRINRGEGRYREIKNNKNVDFAIRNLRQLEKILQSL